MSQRISLVWRNGNNAAVVEESIFCQRLSPPTPSGEISGELGSGKQDSNSCGGGSGTLLAGDVGFAQSAGEATYKAKCQMCHGAKGLADTPAGKSMKVKPI